MSWNPNFLESNNDNLSSKNDFEPPGYHATPKLHLRMEPFTQFATHTLTIDCLIYIMWSLKCYLSSSLNIRRCTSRRVVRMADVRSPPCGLYVLMLLGVIIARSWMHSTVYTYSRLRGNISELTTYKQII